MTHDEALAVMSKYNQWEHARLQAVAILNVDCTHCPSRVGYPCQHGVRNGIGSFLPGYAHIGRKIAWLIMADTLGESPLPAIEDTPATDLDDILGGSEDLSDIL